MKDRIQSLLIRAGINAKSVSVLGKFVHVDSSACHNDRLQHILTAAGFRILRAADGIHLDGYNGFRISAKLV